MSLACNSRTRKGICLIFFLSCLITYTSQNLTKKKLILHLAKEAIHSDSTWEAVEYNLLTIPINFIKRLVGTFADKNIKRFTRKTYSAQVISELPESFNSIDKWPLCTSINEIRDQGGCGGCWAVAATSVITDRVCIYSNATVNSRFSGHDLLSCCSVCGNGCDGGFATIGWERWKLIGLVTGGQFSTETGCQPYAFKPCTMILTFNFCSQAKTPACDKNCIYNYNIKYDDDKHRGKHIYTLTGEDNIKAEIFNNGPVQATMEAYNDLVVYKRGIYHHVDGDSIGKHAVKIVGWGVEGDVKYWLIANSWGRYWGEDGFFRIVRGVDHCGIETDALAGEPSL